MAFAMRINYVDVVCDDSLKNTYVNGKKTGFEFCIRLSYYRGHYLSCIDEFKITVDGEEIADEDVTFGINNKEFNVKQFPYLISEFWQLLEPAHIKVHRPGGLSAGEHNIKVHLMLRIPYMPLSASAEDTEYMPLDSCGEKVLCIKEF
ncbi:DUF6379 domain-containing protein [Clostridium sp. SYSU_GA19001]|uniref:C-glycoside deglycosidase beta subunit domain-containing protein n=1 Tax=Clostridium caldaquaticum TaxID=2940653 RepID=UPI0020771760|nr:DUF6379 domain-containing protein [Clostridium caldaquaticum]MCM8709935.1 DUF6379 domain-containing protein [Clostridium caldaquaticum]